MSFSRHLRPKNIQQQLESGISYAQCWEDEVVLQDALQVGPGDHVLSIASGGDNSLALLLAGADRVTAIDLSEPQLAVTELKVAAARLPYMEFLQLLGLLQDGRRVYLYHRIRDQLSEPARAFWNTHEGVLRQGLLGAGRFERYLATFRTRVLPLVHRPETVDALFQVRDLPSQRAFFETRWNNRRWRALFRVFFSRVVMERTGRSKAHFAQVQETQVSTAFLNRARHALTELPLWTNPYAGWMLRGLYSDLTPEGGAKAYLTRPGHALLQARADRLELVHADLESHLAQTDPGTYSAFNLSNLFEYLPQDAHERLLTQIADRARSGARVAYWNLLVPRSRPARLADRIDVDPARDAALLARDRAFVYGGFHVETVR